MAEPGDHDPAAPAADPDAEIGFCTPESLTGEARRPEPGADPEPAATPEVEPEAAPEAEADLFDAAPPAAEPGPGPDGRDAVGQASAAVAAPSVEAKSPTPSPTPRARAKGPPEGATTLYAVYALILFAVPTFGVSAVIGLLAVIGRDGPSDPLAQSHFLFQRRTLWTAALVAIMGAILIIVGLGVFVLFAVALWTIARGAFGVLRLKADRPIDNPRSWLV